MKTFATRCSPRTDSFCCGQDFGNAEEIVGRGGKDEEPFDKLTPAMPCLAHDAHGLHPAERFLDPLAFDLADFVASMTGGSRIDCRLLF